MGNQKATDETANRLAEQLQSTLSSIRDRQLLIQHGDAMAGRLQASDDIALQLARHQIWFDTQYKDSRADQEMIRCHVQDCVIAMRRLQENQQQKAQIARQHAHQVAVQGLVQEDIAREIHQRVEEHTPAIRPSSSVTPDDIFGRSQSRKYIRWTS